MKKRFLIVLIVLSALGILTYYAEKQKEYRNSVLSGTFENLPTEVASRTSGRVKAIHAKEGTVVKKGDPLLELDPGPLLTELQALRSKAEEARHVLKDLQAGSRPQEIARQQAVVAELEANVKMRDNGSRHQEIAQAQAQLEEAQAHYDKLLRGPRQEEIAQAQAQLNSAQATLEFAASENQRYQNLYESGAVSRQAFEVHNKQFKEAQASLDLSQQNLWELQRGYRQEDKDMAQAGVEQARQKLDELQEGFRSEDKEMARAQLKQAKAQLALLQAGARPQAIAQAQAALKTAELNVKAAQEKLDEYLVSSPLDGLVETKLCAVGDLIEAGTPLMIISDPQDIWIKVYMAQDKLHLVRAGDQAQLLIDGMDGLRPAHVEYIATTGEFTPINLQTPEERGRQVFAVRLRLNKYDPAVKAGMNATVKSLGQWRDGS